MKAPAFAVGQLVRIRQTSIVFEVFAVRGDTIQRVTDGVWFVASFCERARVSRARAGSLELVGPVMP